MSCGCILRRFRPRTGPEHDFFAFVNADFLANRNIPSDRTSCSTWDDISDECDAELAQVVRDAEPDIWKCAMSKCGSDAMHTLLGVADRAASGDAFALGELHAYGVNALFSARVEPSPRDGDNMYILKLGEGGISLPTGRYYRTHERVYRNHILKMMRMADDEYGCTMPYNTSSASAAFEIERWVCFAQMSPADSQDATKTNHVIDFDRLPRGFDWAAYVRGIGCVSIPEKVNVEYMKSLEKAVQLLSGNPSKIRAHLRWRCIDMIASHMGPAWERAQFDFYGRAMLGEKKNRKKAKRRVDVICSLMPYAIGKAFVDARAEDHADNKAAAQIVVQSVAKSLRDTFETSTVLSDKVITDWVSKIDALRYKIGFPDTIPPEDLERESTEGRDWPEFVIASNRRNLHAETARIGHAPNLDRWTDMMPYTVNACFVPELNEIIVPAALLRPPLFDRSQGDITRYLYLYNSSG